MNLFESLRRALVGDYDALTLDHVPTEAIEPDRYAEKLQEAARRHGRAFVCAGDTVPREVLVGGRELVTVAAGQPVPKMQRKT